MAIKNLIHHKYISYLEHRREGTPKHQLGFSHIGFYMPMKKSRLIKLNHTYLTILPWKNNLVVIFKITNKTRIPKNTSLTFGSINCDFETWRLVKGKFI